ncbi:protein of unknown function DUF464 [Sulfobacillus acidophilus TPY]|uniref:Ribosomal processing cysteine protease Prp n=1 Tax=Sulfobacillus acidophilus (strain ATCC 700253 / DSM 10332 / NAL) TaxID=679936 RepID=G8U0A6_SULAD|nr:protein of unknown function DUF464 [Sulfobacillus acidophilus TPY]AEW06448.1 protein of unknown function DUF464 [Sulfobacillus acidophilus DSM 10332]
MIKIRVWRRADGTPTRLLMTGHANRGEYGSDIVCAAASALVETLVMGLTQVVGQAPSGTVDDGKADLTFVAGSSEARAVIDTVFVGLQDLARTAPDAVSWQEFID